MRLHTSTGVRPTITRGAHAISLLGVVALVAYCKLQGQVEGIALLTAMGISAIVTSLGQWLRFGARMRERYDAITATMMWGAMLLGLVFTPFP